MSLHPPCLTRLWHRHFLLLGLALILLCGLVLCLGSVPISPVNVLSILLGNSTGSDSMQQIVLLFRLPRAITALLAGAALGMAGLQMQCLFRNPLADPSLLGVNAGASLGVALVVMAVGWSSALARVSGVGFTLIAASSLGSFTVMLLMLTMAKRVEQSMTLLIVGLMIGYLSNSFVTILMSLALEQELQRYVGWTFGSFAGITWAQMQSLAPTLLLGMGLGLTRSKPMNALLLGEDYAKSLGLDVQRERLFLIACTSLLAGAVTAYCGPIAFLGIAVPHLARLLMRTSDHRTLCPAVLMLGACLALLADLISHVPGSGMVLPLNAVTALMGAPVVLMVILGRGRMVEV